MRIKDFDIIYMAHRVVIYMNEQNKNNHWHYCSEKSSQYIKIKQTEAKGRRCRKIKANERWFGRGRGSEVLGQLCYGSVSACYTYAKAVSRKIFWGGHLLRGLAGMEYPPGGGGARGGPPSQKRF